jgi:hypothetical protein
MENMIHDISGLRVFVLPGDGPLFTHERDFADVVGTTLGQGVDIVAIPVSRLTDDFFRLSTRLAGEVLQKFVNYKLRVAIVGDMSRWTAQSRPLRDFVSESNRGRSVWFVTDLDELERRLAEARHR